MTKLRFCETHGCKISKELTAHTILASISEYSKLFAELVPEEEEHPGDGDQAIYAFHFDKDVSKAHGVPFKFIVKPVGTLAGKV